MSLEISAGNPVISRIDPSTADPARLVPRLGRAGGRPRGRCDQRGLALPVAGDAAERLRVRARLLSLQGQGAGAGTTLRPSDQS